MRDFNERETSIRERLHRHHHLEVCTELLVTSSVRSVNVLFLSTCFSSETNGWWSMYWRDLPPTHFLPFFAHFFVQLAFLFFLPSSSVNFSRLLWPSSSVSLEVRDSRREKLYFSLCFIICSRNVYFFGRRKDEKKWLRRRKWLSVWSNKYIVEDDVEEKDFLMRSEKWISSRKHYSAW